MRGFAAAGSAGKALVSATPAGAACFAFDGVERVVVLVDVPAHGVVIGLPLPDLLAAAGIELESVEDAVPQLAVRLTAERLDCAVELLSLRTRLPPRLEAPTVALEPGSDG